MRLSHCFVDDKVYIAESEMSINEGNNAKKNFGS